MDAVPLDHGHCITESLSNEIAGRLAVLDEDEDADGVENAHINTL